MWGGMIPYKIIQIFFILLPSSLTLLQVDDFLLTVVYTCTRSCDTDNSTQSFKRMYYHTATEGP